MCSNNRNLPPGKPVALNREVILRSVLSDLIVNTVATKAWGENGGTGNMTSYRFQDRCLLVICQPEEVHEQITALLAALRWCAATDAKPGTELRLPKRPKATAPTIYVAPGGPPPSTQGGGLF